MRHPGPLSARVPNAHPLFLPGSAPSARTEPTPLRAALAPSSHPSYPSPAAARRNGAAGGELVTCSERPAPEAQEGEVPRGAPEKPRGTASHPPRTGPALC